MSTNNPDLSIIIVNWNTKNLLQKCLESIYKTTRKISYEIFVVDNASSDKSALMVEENFKKVKLIKNKENMGFAKANNQAIKQALGRYILLLNPDTLILNNALNKMVEFLETHPKIGILGPQLLNTNGSLQLSCRTFPTLSSQIIILLKLHHIFPNLSPVKKYFMSDWKHDKAKEVDQVMGACFMVRKKVCDQIGLFDEKYWIWFEEVDFCKRAKNKSWKIYFLPQVKILHHQGQSFKQLLSIKKQIKFNNSLLRYFKKHHSLASYLCILSLYPISLSLAALVELGQLLKPSKSIS